MTGISMLCGKNPLGGSYRPTESDLQVSRREARERRSKKSAEVVIPIELNRRTPNGIYGGGRGQKKSALLDFQF